MVASRRLRAWVGMAALGMATHGWGAAELDEAAFLDSGDMIVLTASRLAQPIMDAPNAITVLDRATIQASGYHNLADLFRLVPGMYVGQKNGWYYNVSHTMADEFSRRMQVLVDGRSIYLPTIGGPRWDTLPLVVDDIERIEVVRSPNAATFGANALTGVINIITRHPQDVVGRMLHLVTGDHEHREGWFRWAGGSDGAVHRVTVGRREDSGFPLQLDDERSNIANYRGEFTLDPRRTLGVQAGLLAGERANGETTLAPVQIRHANDQPHDQEERSLYLQADYRSDLDDERTLSVKAYFSESTSHADVPVVAGTFVTVLPPWIAPSLETIPPNTTYSTNLDARRWHLEGQIDSQVEADLRVSYGGFLRRDSVRSQHYFNESDWIDVDSWALFAHAEKRLATDWLLNLGAFWEDYGLVGGRLSPRVALNWQPTANQTVRLAVSRAYRNPVVFESKANWVYHYQDPLGTVIPPYVPVITSENIAPEEIVSREISYFGNWPEAGLSVDARIFHEHIEDYIFLKQVGGTFLRTFANLGDTRQEGAELQVKWRPHTGTQILANYAFLRIDSHLDETRYSPPRLAGLHLMHQFPGGIDLTLSQYWTGAFKPIGQGNLPGVHRWDARVAKRFKLESTRAELAFGVLNGGKPYYEFDDGPKHLFDTRGYLHLKLEF